MVEIGQAQIECPECHTIVAVPIDATIDHDEDGQWYLNCQPDMADIWAHAWTHGPEASDGERS